MSRPPELICSFDKPSSALAARQSLRELGKEVRGLRLGSIAVVTRPSVERVLFEQDGDVGVGAGTRFGVLVGALVGAVILGPVAALVAVGNAIEPGISASNELAIALAAALASGLTALASAVGGALIGAIAAALINLGVSIRLLRRVGEDLTVGHAALVTRVHPLALAAVGDELRLRGGRLMRPGEAGDVTPDDVAASRFVAEAQSRPAGPLPFVPLEQTTSPVDPRQQDIVTALFDSPGQARRARRRLHTLRRRRHGPTLGSIAVVARDESGRARSDQSENVGPWRGALFGGSVGGIVGALALGVFLMLVVMATSAVNLGDKLPDDELVVTALVSLGVGGVIGLLLFGGLGALIGGAVAGLLNFGYIEADLARISARVPEGKALLTTMAYHHGVPQVVEALTAMGGRLQGEPLPSEDLADAARLAEREQALATSDVDAADTRRLVTTRSGVRIFCDWRRRSDQTIVLLHGAGGDHLAWSVQYPTLHAAGYSTLALDLRGHGYSDRPREADAYKLERFADDVYDVLSTLGIDDFIIVGHCFGGMVTTMFHRAHPTLSRGYILLDTAAHAPALPRWLATNTPWAINLAGKVLELLPDARQRLLHADMQSFKGTRDIEPTRLISDAQHTTLRAWLLVYRGIAQYDGVEALKTMSQPVWVAVGEKDTVFTVADSEYIQQHILGSKLVVIPEANHIIVVNNPEEVQRIILEFIAEQAPFAVPG